VDILCLILLALAGLALTVLTLRDFPITNNAPAQAAALGLLIVLALLYWFGYSTIGALWLKFPLFFLALVPSVPFLAHVIRRVLIRAAEEIVSLDRVEVMPSASRAAAAERRGDFAEAERLYREVIRRTPGDPGPRRQLAELLARLGRSDEAIEEYRRLMHVVRTPADKYLVAFDIADIIANQKKDVWGAIEELEHILREFPESTSAAFARERIAILRSRLDDVGN